MMDRGILRRCGGEPETQLKDTNEWDRRVTPSSLVKRLRAYSAGPGNKERSYIHEFRNCSSSRHKHLLFTMASLKQLGRLWNPKYCFYSLATVGKQRRCLQSTRFDTGISVRKMSPSVLVVYKCQCSYLSLPNSLSSILTTRKIPYKNKTQNSQTRSSPNLSPTSIQTPPNTKQPLSPNTTA